MAELLLRDQLGRRFGPASELVATGSAGTDANRGAPIAERSGSLLAARGIDVDSFRSRRLEAEMVDAADLVLAATRAHRALVVQMRPSASRYTFLLREFSWLIEEVHRTDVSGDDLATRVNSLVSLARGQRGMRMPQYDLDLADPYGCRMGVYRKTIQLLDESLDVMLDRLECQPSS